MFENDDELNAFRKAFNTHLDRDEGHEENCNECDKEDCPFHPLYDGPDKELFAKLRDVLQENSTGEEGIHAVRFGADGPVNLSEDELHEMLKDAVAASRHVRKRTAEEIFDNYVHGLHENLQAWSHEKLDMAEVDAELIALNLRIQIREAEVTHATLFDKGAGKNAEERKANVEFALTHDPDLVEHYNRRAELEADKAHYEANTDVLSRSLHTMVSLLQAHESDYRTRVQEREFEATQKLLGENQE